MELFGFSVTRKQPEPASFTPRQTDDGAAVIAGAGAYGTVVDIDGSIRTEAELVNKYREMANYPEVDSAIDDIVNEIVTYEPEQKLVELILDDVELPPKIKNILVDEFDGVQNLLEFQNIAYETVRRWYIDGRLYYHAIIDEAQPQAGIIELRYVDPRKIRKVREQNRKRTASSVQLVQDGKEYFIYNDKGFAKSSGTNAVPTNNIGGIKIAKDSIIHCTSGLLSESGDLVLSHLHPAIRPLNQLRSMEDSLVIYRISRAPERRIFYIDVGNLPKAKAEQHLRDVMVRFKNKVTYDAATGQVRDDRKFMTMLEDFWLPRRGEGKGTEITTLPGGQNLGQMTDVEYFQDKLYKALKVPISRLNPEAQFNFGRATEISRDEVKFAKFISRLRNRFAILFTSVLERQVILKSIMTPDEWEYVKSKIRYKFSRDNYWDELKESEILRERMATVSQMDPYIGKYFSHDFIRRKILMQSDEEIEEIDEQIAGEMQNPQYHPELLMPQDGSDGNMPPQQNQPNQQIDK